MRVSVIALLCLGVGIAGGQPLAKEAGNEGRVVCYYSSWAAYRLGDGNFQIEDVDASLCTHFIYAFTGLDASTFEMISLDTYMDYPDNGGKNAFSRATGLKSANPALKVLLAMGGWNEGSYKYSVMAGDADRRKAFLTSVVNILELYGFDGLDIDWEYPGSRGGAVVDKQNLIVLLKEMREEFDKHGWLLTIAVGMDNEVADYGYDMPQITQYVDFVNLMTYDLRGSWDGMTGHHTQLYRRPEDTDEFIYYNLNTTVHFWIDSGASRNKLNLGIAFYGKTFNVLYNNGPLDTPCAGAGMAGEYTQQSGFIGYNEFCLKMKEETWITETDELVGGPWSYKDDQWVAYDNYESVVLKSNWAKELGLGGGMSWSIEKDDFKGNCGNGKFPLLKAMNSVWRDGATLAPTQPPVTTTTTTLKPGETPPTTTTTTTTENPLFEDCNSGGLNNLKTNLDDCNSYFQCAPSHTGGSWVRQKCPGGLFFNSDRNLCDWVSGADCTP